MRGVPRGKIRPGDGSLISIRAELGQVGFTSGAFVMCNRSRVQGLAGTPGISGDGNWTVQNRPRHPGHSAVGFSTADPLAAQAMTLRHSAMSRRPSRPEVTGSAAAVAARWNSMSSSLNGDS
jgi:hypothetical protein